LPGVEEGTSYGTPAFRVSGKFLARLREDGESLVIKVEYAVREVLMAANPETFYITDHYSCYPMMLVRLSKVKPDELRGLLEEAEEPGPQTSCRGPRTERQVTVEPVRSRQSRPAWYAVETIDLCREPIDDFRSVRVRRPL
jgi:hypothetical protein